MPEQAVGQSIVSWETLEFQKHERSPLWYLIAGIVGILLLLYALLTASFPFAVIILLIGIIMFIGHMHDPQRVTVHVTTNGVVVGSRFYPYREIKDFSMVYEPPQVKLLYVDFLSPLKPMLSIPLDDQDPNKVREALLPYVVENLRRDQETLTDMFARLYKL